jgi:hypothetical protein
MGYRKTHGNYKGGTQKVKQRISQKPAKSKGQIAQVREEFSGRNLTCFGGSGLIRVVFQAP